jgi:hypothetical protein
MQTLKLAKSWGEWVRRRARFVGIASDARFAQETGSTPQTICRLIALADAPCQMRSGRDLAFARALCASRQMLFGGWRDIAPEAVPVITVDESESLRRRIGAIIELLPPEKLREFFSQGQTLLHGEAQSHVA